MPILLLPQLLSSWDDFQDLDKFHSRRASGQLVELFLQGYRENNSWIRFFSVIFLNFEHSLKIECVGSNKLAVLAETVVFEACFLSFLPSNFQIKKCSKQEVRLVPFIL